MTDTTEGASAASQTAAGASVAGAPAAAPPPAATFAVGNLVSYTWEDTYAIGPDGKGAERTRYGIVVAVVPGEEGAADSCTVSWLEGAATMPADLLAGV